MPPLLVAPRTGVDDLVEDWDDVEVPARLKPLFRVFPLMPPRLEEIVVRYLVFRERELKKPVIASSLRTERAYGISIENASRAGYSAHEFDTATNLLWYHVGGKLKALEDVLALYVRATPSDETRTHTKEPK